MANPRKFSEKIALHNQKQAEETAEFEKIMREVSDATNKGSIANRHLHLAQPLGEFRAGSLPNVNNYKHAPQIDFKAVLCNMEELKRDQPSEIRHKERSRGNVGPMRSRPTSEKRMDSSPYSSAYLSPPPASDWRRTASDSALHTSSQDTQSQLASMSGGRSSQSHLSGVHACHVRRSGAVSPDGRPRSISDVPRLQGMSVLPLQDPGNVQIPIINNTGSLPDLTSFQFPSPLNTPIDHDDRVSPFQTGISPHDSYQPSYIYHQQASPQPLNSQEGLTTLGTTNYRNPVTRPSPQTSPALQVKYDTGNSRCTTPQSPSSPASISSSAGMFQDQNHYFTQAQAMYQDFEQFNMREEGWGSTETRDVPVDAGYFSTSPLQHIPFGNRPLQSSTTPTTPGGIPNIRITDFSNELVKDLGSAMAGSLEEAIDLLPSEAELFLSSVKEDLNPIDPDALQILANDPEMIADAATEDHFRLDRM